MITERSTTVVSLLRDNVHRFGAVIAIAGLAELADNYVEMDRPVLSIAAVALLVTALSIFLVFRVNEAYQRWWEARTLWGAIVNDSRSFARQVFTLLTPRDESDAARAEVRQLRRELVLRQIAWAHALRLTLRRQEDDGALPAFLAESELGSLADRSDKPSQLLLTQAECLAEAREAGQLGEISQHRIETTLTSLQNAQGGCERIKNTPFPDRMAHFTLVSAWGLAIILPASLMTKSAGVDLIDYVVVPFMMMAFLLTERLGAELKNPFENAPNDTPMTALCRTVEIALLEQLGDAAPPPLEPVKGVLM